MNSIHLSGIELKGLWKEFKNRKKTWDESREIETMGVGKREWNEQGKIKREKTENETSVWCKTPRE